jgi:hypothetical protein
MTETTVFQGAAEEAGIGGGRYHFRGDHGHDRNIPDQEKSADLSGLEPKYYRFQPPPLDKFDRMGGVRD